MAVEGEVTIPFVVGDDGACCVGSGVVQAGGVVVEGVEGDEDVEVGVGAGVCISGVDEAD